MASGAAEEVCEGVKHIATRRDGLPLVGNMLGIKPILIVLLHYSGCKTTMPWRAAYVDDQHHFFLALLICSLFAVGLYLNMRSEDPHEFSDADLKDMRGDQGLLCNWEGLTPFEQKMQLALYQRSVSARGVEE